MKKRTRNVNTISKTNTKEILVSHPDRYQKSTRLRKKREIDSFASRSLIESDRKDASALNSRFLAQFGTHSVLVSINEFRLVLKLMSSMIHRRRRRRRRRRRSVKAYFSTNRCLNKQKCLIKFHVVYVAIIQSRRVHLYLRNVFVDVDVKVTFVLFSFRSTMRINLFASSSEDLSTITSRHLLFRSIDACLETSLSSKS